MAVDLQILNRAAEKIQIAMGLKLLQLRRSASGALINSFSHNIMDLGGYSFDLKIFALSYWRVVNYGVSGSNIPYDANRRSGAKNSKYIEGLMRWIKIKGIASDNNVVKGIAFAIATKQTSKGGWGKGNPMDKGKLGFLEKTKAERDEIVRTQIAPAYQAEIISLVTKDLSGRFDLII